MTGLADGVNQSNRAPVIGLAGGIAAGKSLVADELRRLGALVIDSDELIHQELAKREVVEALRGWWGEAACGSDGRVDRRKIGEIVFNDVAERVRLESYLHPRIEARRREMMAACDGDANVRAVVINAPLLYEVGLDAACDVVIFVECDRAKRVARAGNTRGWTEAEYDRREKAQKPLDAKAAAADHTVVNNSTVDALRSQIQTLFAQLVSRRTG
ncbi:MAG: dephospho-CoA kinase [Phycisphaerales bacterium]|nr:dephospho-CoA kinase [Phycisphaerales bacterium]